MEQNLNVTWHTEEPDFTECFQRTVLVWLPCAFLWLFSFLDVFYIKNSINRNIPRGFLNSSKLILTGTLILLSIVDLIVVIVNKEEQDIFPVDYFTPAIKITTFVSKEKICQAEFRQYFSFLNFRHCQLHCWNSIEDSACECLDFYFCSGSFCWSVAFHSCEHKFGGVGGDQQILMLTNMKSTISLVILFSMASHSSFGS